MNSIDLKGRVAIVTGGARGIGFAITERMLASGASVAIWDVDQDAMARAKTSLSNKGKVFTAKVDVTDENSIAPAVASLMKDAGKIDILVNNAGITGGNAPTWELSPEVWRQVINVNLIGLYLVSRAVVTDMLAAKYGRLVNIASLAGKEGNPNA